MLIVVNKQSEEEELILLLFFLCYIVIVNKNIMLYFDLSAEEIKKLIEFHKKYPTHTLRIFSDEMVNKTTYRKRVIDFYGNETDIADNPLD